MEQILLTAIVLLIASFLLHWVWWRVKLPRNQTKTLLLIFFLTPWPMVWLFSLPCAAWAQLALLYISVALMYIAAYSAIENQSPTLALIDRLGRSGRPGLTRDEIAQALNLGNEIETRVRTMQRTGLLLTQDEMLRLTPKGMLMAHIFSLGAKCFGLKGGG